MEKRGECFGEQGMMEGKAANKTLQSNRSSNNTQMKMMMMILHTDTNDGMLPDLSRKHNCRCTYNG